MEISTVKAAMEKPLEPKVMDLEEVLGFFSVETRKIIKLGKFSVSQQVFLVKISNPRNLNLFVSKYVIRYIFTNFSSFLWFWNLLGHPVSLIKRKVTFFRDAGMYDRPNLTTNTTSIRGDPQNKDTCPRCGGIVFHAERMLSKNNVRIQIKNIFVLSLPIWFLVFP